MPVNKRTKKCIDTLPVTPKPSQLMPCGHPQSAVISSEPDGVGTCYCSECAKEKMMSVNKRQKKRVDKYLTKMCGHFPEEVAEIQRLLDHYEGVISDWQQATGQLHPTLTGVFEAREEEDEAI